MTIRQVCDIKNNQLIINLPEDFRNKKSVFVTVEDSVDKYSEKMLLLKKAATDPLFIADIKEIKDDFKTIDLETK
jgi:hypothetical protein